MLLNLIGWAVVICLCTVHPPTAVLIAIVLFYALDREGRRGK